MRRSIVGVAAVVGLCLVSSARAALLTPIEQTLHCSTQARIDDLYKSAWDKPADVAVGATYGAFANQSSVIVEGDYEYYPGQFSHAVSQAQTALQTRIDENGIHASGSGFYTYGGALGENGEIECKVNIAFDLTQATQFKLTLATSPYGFEDVILSRSGQSIMAMSLPGYMPGDSLPPGHTQVDGMTSIGSSLALEPGHYQIVFSYGMMTHTGTFSAGTAIFSMVAVPEPAGMGVIGLGLLALRRRR